MSGFEIAGAALAVAGLLLSIKGAVDGYIFLADICEKDNGLRFAATQYYVEKVKLSVWAERFKVDDEANCLLLKQPRITRDAVWRIIAEINATHELAVDFIAKYHAEPAALPPPAAQSAVAGLETFHRQSKWVSMVRDARARIPQAHRVSWAAKDRAKFAELIARLGVLNADLWDVVTADDTDTVRIVTGVLSGLRDQLSLATLQASPANNNSPASLLALAAQLKQMQGESVSDLAAKVKTIDATELHVSNGTSNDIASRFRGTYTPQSPPGLPEPVWIEWKAIQKDNASLPEIELRIRALGALLTSTPDAAAFHRPHCLGMYDDVRYRERTGGNRRIGFVYRSEGGDLPVPLLDLLREAARTRTRPALGERFRLAYQLASAVSLFHAADWIHKSLRSDAVLFPSRKGGLAAPQIARFQYSRPAADTSLESRPAEAPELEVYYHPDVAAGGWNKVREIYGLGIVLLEIAHWRPLFEPRFGRMAPREVARSVLDDLEGKFGEDLKGLVGGTFVDVIKCCLTGSFGVVSGTSADESKALSDAFFLKIVRPLASLSA